MVLTEEQKRRMEQKKAEALAKIRTKPSNDGGGSLQGLTEQQRMDLEEKKRAAKQIQLNKSSQPVKSNNLISNFYSKPPRVLKGSCSLISPTRFELEVGYHQQLIDTVKSLPTAQYNATKKTWSFLIVEHDSVLRRLQSFKPEVEISPLPRMSSMDGHLYFVLLIN